jgi:hypothetical protein
MIYHTSFSGASAPVCASTGRMRQDIEREANPAPTGTGLRLAGAVSR